MDERVSAETCATSVVLRLHLIKVLEPNSRQKRTTAPPSLPSASLTCLMHCRSKSSNIICAVSFTQYRLLQNSISWVFYLYAEALPITVTAQSRAWTLFARSNAGIVGSNPTQGMDVCLRFFCVCVVLCEDSGLATGSSPVRTKGCRAVIIIIIIMLYRLFRLILSMFFFRSVQANRVFSILSSFCKNKRNLIRSLCCLCVPPIVARLRLGKNFPQQRIHTQE
jgi:hypothetical protein